MFLSVRVQSTRFSISWQIDQLFNWVSFFLVRCRNSRNSIKCDFNFSFAVVWSWILLSRSHQFSTSSSSMYFLTFAQWSNDFWSTVLGQLDDCSNRHLLFLRNNTLFMFLSHLILWFSNYLSHSVIKVHSILFLKCVHNERLILDNILTKSYFSSH